MWAPEKVTANYPLDLWAPEFSPWLSMLNFSPHILISTSFLLLIFLLLLKDSKRDDYKLTWFISLLALIYWQFHPYYYILVFFIWGCYLLALFVKNKKINFLLLKKIIIVWLISSISFLYHLYLVFIDQFYSLKRITNITKTPRIDVLLISYGFILLFALFGFYILFKEIYKKKSNDSLSESVNYPIFLLTYFCTNFVLLYFPLNIQRRFIQGYYIILVILSLIVFDKIIKKIKTLKLNLSIFSFGVFVFYVLFFLPSIIFTIDYQVRDYKISPELYYISSQTKELLSWIKVNVEDEDIIFTDFFTSRLIPGFSGKRVYWGHWSETLYVKSKKKFWDEFSDGTIKESKLNEAKIDIIVIKAKDFNKDVVNSLNHEILYKNDDYIVIKLIK